MNDPVGIWSGQTTFLNGLHQDMVEETTLIFSADHTLQATIEIEQQMLTGSGYWFQESDMDLLYTFREVIQTLPLVGEIQVVHRGSVEGNRLVSRGMGCLYRGTRPDTTTLHLTETRLTRQRTTAETMSGALAVRRHDEPNSYDELVQEKVSDPFEH